MFAKSKTVILSGAAPLAVAAGFLAIDSKPALACGAEPYLGEVCFFAFNYCPQGYSYAGGQQMPVSNYQALYALLGTMYGGNSQQFNLPNLIGRTPIGADSTSNIGKAIGNAQVTLTSTNLPAHIHSLSGQAVPVTLNGLSVPFNAAPPPTTTLTNFANGATVYPTNGVTATAGGNSIKGIYTATAPTAGAQATMPVTASGTVQVSGNTGVTGASAPINVQSPALNLTVCIATDNALWPPRP